MIGFSWTYKELIKTFGPRSFLYSCALLVNPVWWSCWKKKKCLLVLKNWEPTLSNEKCKKNQAATFTGEVTYLVNLTFHQKYHRHLIYLTVVHFRLEINLSPIFRTKIKNSLCRTSLKQTDRKRFSINQTWSERGLNIMNKLYELNRG